MTATIAGDPSQPTVTMLQRRGPAGTAEVRDEAPTVAAFRPHRRHAMGSIHLQPIERQVVVIVGCSSGIGRQTARRFAEREARLVLVARADEALGDILDQVGAMGARDGIGVEGDVTSPGDMQAVVRAATESFGRINPGVHAAAVSVYATAEETTPDEYRRGVGGKPPGPVPRGLPGPPGPPAPGGGGPPRGTPGGGGGAP